MAILTILFDIWYQILLYAYFMHKSYLVFYGNSERIRAFADVIKLEMGFSFTLIIHVLWDLVPFDSRNFIMKTSYKIKKSFSENCWHGFLRKWNSDPGTNQVAVITERSRHDSRPEVATLLSTFACLLTINRGPCLRVAAEQRRIVLPSSEVRCACPTNSWDSTGKYCERDLMWH